jgi:hypothetical protein
VALLRPHDPTFQASNAHHGLPGARRRRRVCGCLFALSAQWLLQLLPEHVRFPRDHERGLLGLVDACLQAAPLPLQVRNVLSTRASAAKAAAVTAAAAAAAGANDDGGACARASKRMRFEGAAAAAAAAEAELTAAAVGAAGASVAPFTPSGGGSKRRNGDSGGGSSSGGSGGRSGGSGGGSAGGVPAHMANLRTNISSAVSMLEVLERAPGNASPGAVSDLAASICSALARATAAAAAVATAAGGDGRTRPVQ